MTQARLKECVDTIEKSYELFLAYAAQGLPGDAGSPRGAELRDCLEHMDAALGEIVPLLQSHIQELGREPAERYEAFLAILESDAQAARAAVQLVRVQPSISSQLIDNLNASIHLRALLTDLFLIDEALSS